MLGTVRFILALLVVLNHLWLPTANKVGAHAVVAFYIVSGYLMTLSIQKTYGLTLKGAGAFLANRALRIFPIYWSCLTATLLLLLIYGDAFKPYSTITLTSTYDLFRNVSLIDLTSSPSILVPPAWSLMVEFSFYLAMVVLLSRSRTISTIWFIASLIFTVWLVWHDAPFRDRYYPLTAASLFFSIGATLFWYRLPGPPPRMLWPLLITFCALPFLSQSAGIDPLMTGYYVAVILFIPIFLIANTKPSATDKWLGDLAYPLFLSHFLCAGTIKVAMPHLQPLQAPFLIASLLISIVLSIGAVHLQARTVEKIRSRLRVAPSQS